MVHILLDAVHEEFRRGLDLDGELLLRRGGKSLTGQETLLVEVERGGTAEEDAEQRTAESPERLLEIVEHGLHARRNRRENA